MTSKKSREYVLVTKECIATHTIYYNFKTALYSSAIVMKGFTSSRKLF